MKEYHLYLLPFTAAIICYLNSLGGQLVHDDIPAIVHNQDVVTPEQPLMALFSHDYWGKPMWDNTSHKSYRPLTVVTFRLNYFIGGLNPVGYHIVNVVLHAAVSSLFTHLCYTAVFKDIYSALLAGLIFAVHPIHTEVVSNIVSRAEILSGLFFLLSYSYFLSSREKRNNQCLLKCVILAVLALMCKEQGVTVLGVCWLQSAYSLIRRKTKSTSNSSTLIALTASILVILSLRMSLLYGHTPHFLREDNPAAFEDNNVTRWLTHWYIYSLNAWLLICPSRLCHDWQFGTVPLLQQFIDIRNMYTALFVCALSARCLRAISTKKDNAGRIGLLFLIIPFLPATNLFFKVGFVIAERTLYIPSMGYTILFVQAIQSINQLFGKKKCATFVLIILISFVVKTIIRNNVWHSRETLARSGIETFPHNAKMQFNYANILRDHGLHGIAEQHYKEAIRLWPGYASAHNNLATLLLTRNTSYAKHHFQEAIRACPNHANAHFNLGTQLWLEENYGGALFYLEKTLQLDPHCAPCHINMASIFCDKKDVTKAMSHFEKALHKSTDITLVIRRYITCLKSLEHDQGLHKSKSTSKYKHNEDHSNDVYSATTVISTQNHTQSYKQYQPKERYKETSSNTHRDSIVLKKTLPHDFNSNHIQDFQPNITIQLAILLAKHGNHKQAASLLEEVVDMVHENNTKAEIYFLLGECYKDNGNLQLAIIAFENTLVMSSKHVGAHHNLAVAYHLQKDIINAQFHYNAALQLEPTNHLLLQNYRKFQAIHTVH